MKKKIRSIAVTFLCLLIAGLLIGCSSNKNTAVSPAGNSQNQENSPSTGTQPDQTGNNISPNDLKQWDGVKGKIMTSNYPSEIAEYLEDKQQNERQQAFNINNRTYIVMTMGRQSSSGYQIELKDIVLKDGTLTVEVKYEKPGKDDNALTVITYPSLVIETDDIYEGHYLIKYDIEK